MLGYVEGKYLKTTTKEIGTLGSNRKTHLKNYTTSSFFPYNYSIVFHLFL